MRNKNKHRQQSAVANLAALATRKSQSLCTTTRLPHQLVSIVVVLAVGCSASGLRGVGLIGTDTFQGGVRVSYAGGGDMNIAASGQTFDTVAYSNRLLFRNTNFSSDEMVLPLPPMSGKFSASQGFDVIFDVFQ